MKLEQTVIYSEDNYGKNIEDLKLFLENSTNLNYEIYSPNF